MSTTVVEKLNSEVANLDDDLSDENERIDKEAERKLLEIETKIINICETYNIEFRKEYGLFEKILIVRLPRGRGFREISISTLQEAETMLSNNFEKIRYLEKFNAFFNSETGVLIAAASEIGNRAAGAGRLRRRSELIRDMKGNDSRSSVIIRNETSASKQVIYMNILPSRFRGLFGNNGQYIVALHGFSIAQLDDGERILLEISNSLFFQIEQTFGVCLMIGRMRGKKMDLDSVGHDKSLDNTVEFPRYEYAAAPMSLYWYGVSSSSLPLMQFLAFYQVIEYFFPAMSSSAARRQMQNVLKSPGFRVDRDADIGRLLTIGRSYASYGYGSEKTQLESTVRECVMEDDIRSFFENNGEIGKFFMKSTPKISFKNQSIDIIKEISTRIYEIRCRIVHSKAEGNSDLLPPLLPYSEDAENLLFDILLVKFLAAKILSAAARPLEFR